MFERLGRINCIFFLLHVGIQLQAQEAYVRGGFVQDSLQIGENIQFWMTAYYDPKHELFFPDSTYNFLPFEWTASQHFPSVLINEKALDSTVYTLQSYEIDNVQYLALPAFILDGVDTVTLLSATDSIYLQELAPNVSDTTKLKTNLSYLEVDRKFNYPLWYIVGGFVVFSLLLTLLLFGKKIRRYFVLRKLKKHYLAFSQKLTEHIHALQKDPNESIAESGLILWKNYQEKLEKSPFSKYTTKDILSLDYTGVLEKPLKSIDRMVYGKKRTDSIHQDFQQIEDFTQHRYLKKVEEINNAK